MEKHAWPRWANTAQHGVHATGTPNSAKFPSCLIWQLVHISAWTASLCSEKVWHAGIHFMQPFPEIWFPRNIEDFFDLQPLTKIISYPQVLEPNWHVMHNRLQSAKSIDEVKSSICITLYYLFHFIFFFSFFLFWFSDWRGHYLIWHSDK